MFAARSFVDLAMKRLDLAHQHEQLVRAVANSIPQVLESPRQRVDGSVQFVQALYRQPRVDAEGLRAARAVLRRERLLVERTLAPRDVRDGVGERTLRARRRFDALDVVTRFSRSRAVQHMVDGGAARSIERGPRGLPFARVAVQLGGDLGESLIQTGQGLFEIVGAPVIRQAVDARFETRQRAANRPHAGGLGLLRDLALDAAQPIHHDVEVIGVASARLRAGLDQLGQIFKRLGRLFLGFSDAPFDGGHGAVDNLGVDSAMAVFNQFGDIFQGLRCLALAFGDASRDQRRGALGDLVGVEDSLGPTAKFGLVEIRVTSATRRRRFALRVPIAARLPRARAS